MGKTVGKKSGATVPLNMKNKAKCQKEKVKMHILFKNL
jgi:hypothetical protein